MTPENEYKRLWEKYDVSVICNYDSMEKNEDLTIEFYDKRRAELESKEPNRAHKVIAQLQKEYGSNIAVITQNVDNLFEKAGMSSDDVIHLHGFLKSDCAHPRLHIPNLTARHRQRNSRWPASALKHRSC